MPSLLDTFSQRGLLHSATAGTAQALQQGPMRAYLGVDPTAASLHVGHLATLMLLRHLQQGGHAPFVVLGGATALVGDPSFKATERTLLDPEALRAHQQAIGAQIAALWEAQGAELTVLNNYTWHKDFALLEFLRKVGKHVSVNTLLGKEALKRRLTTGISYLEFTYPLLQAYDFYHLYQAHGVKLQLGGSDQWGNITAGAELIRKKAGGQAYGLTAPLLTKADGTKFGKSEQGNVWLDDSLTSPYHFYQFWLNVEDAQALPLLQRLTLTPDAQLQELAGLHAAAPHQRRLQHELARAMTTLVHGHTTCTQVAQASELLFGKAPMEALGELPQALLLQVLEGVPQLQLSQGQLDGARSLTDLLTSATQGRIFPSRRAAREVITAGGLRLNKARHTDPEAMPELHWLHGRYLLVQKGKKGYYLLCRS